MENVCDLFLIEIELPRRKIKIFYHPGPESLLPAMSSLGAWNDSTWLVKFFSLSERCGTFSSWWKISALTYVRNKNISFCPANYPFICRMVTAVDSNSSQHILGQQARKHWPKCFLQLNSCATSVVECHSANILAANRKENGSSPLGQSVPLNP